MFLIILVFICVSMFSTCFKFLKQLRHVLSRPEGMQQITTLKALRLHLDLQTMTQASCSSHALRWLSGCVLMNKSFFGLFERPERESSRREPAEAALGS